ncbi:TetR/AcrR family transcriptional regulator [Brevibacillus laterosporus]|uniref:TetR family transcriptional regulator n=1 Tax=Brevibacillus laterosporus TaxID=1465 RepID=A0AAP8QAT9_BRELA|nr:TetR/AcrR family transcriptional regulator [Brevibacillus laterosporus]MCR8980767.1 TetR family transcriptional regulator [Brevibacillus laterosporus]MCZ0807922.1 TetR/AcrR family transcriptional regulator [Brevibacillus laterosporus]MCZ0826187.1 TetR/AcrR family transcriptional regulator [Brevibacillus laterosporus]MCZ0851198.1 TetR/AcrR family transcriptional regulator [Brevibacillus laterosporus]MED1663313.1 TetR/AcrR family transcriptional regulator [Brevibacillus laterosporus]
MNNNSGEEKQSFIAEARREQIIEAAIKTLDEIGYVKASLSQIAQRAGISTALISYHFSDKNDLMNHLLTKLLESSTSYILGKVRKEDTPKRKLDTFIVASLAYQGSHPTRNSALLEIIFNARTPDNIPYYKLGDDEDQIMYELQQILRDGQEKGEFGAFHVDVMANTIQGAIGEYMGNAAITKKVDLETYTNELIDIVGKATKGMIE